MSNMTNDELVMRLWREDLKRTNYGQCDDTRPPLPARLDDDLDPINVATMRCDYLYRVAKRLMAHGWKLKTCAKALNISVPSLVVRAYAERFGHDGHEQ